MHPARYRYQQRHISVAAAVARASVTAAAVVHGATPLLIDVDLNRETF